MRAFIKAIDEQAWDTVEDGWTPPEMLDEDVIIVSELKALRTDLERTLNSRAVNALFGAMNKIN